MLNINAKNKIQKIKKGKIMKNNLKPLNIMNIMRIYGSTNKLSNSLLSCGRKYFVFSILLSIMQNCLI